eukprot:364938_1
MAFEPERFSCGSIDMLVYCGHGLNKECAPKIALLIIDFGNSGKTILCNLLYKAGGDRAKDMPRECWVGSEQAGKEYTQRLYGRRGCTLLIMDEGSSEGG